MPLALTIQKWLLVEYKDDFKLYSKYLEKKTHNNLSMFLTGCLVLIH